MKPRASIPLISILAAVIAFVGWGLVWVPQVKAQDKKALGNAQGVAAQPSGDLSERIARLEQRILDMQGVIATLQSFVAGGAGASAPGGLPPGGGSPAAGGTGGAPSEVNIRVLALETQIRALTGQMEQISAKLNQIPGSTGAGTPPLRSGHQLVPGQQPGAASQPASPQLQASGGGAQFESPAQTVPQFGTTATAPAPASPFEQAMRAPPQSTSAPQLSSPTHQTAQLPSVPGLSASGGSARGIYDASYQNFLRNDLPAAEQGFSSFVNSFPDDPLTSNAYYWLGRTHFERKKFEQAAKAFLAGYKKNKKSAIAADALLHLGMSLVQLGEKDAACSTLGAIKKQFPGAPDKLKQDAATALKSARC
jgi:tol-pal system protein YbgF